VGLLTWITQALRHIDEHGVTIDDALGLRICIALATIMLVCSAFKRLLPLRTAVQDQHGKVPELLLLITFAYTMVKFTTAPFQASAIR